MAVSELEGNRTESQRLYSAWRYARANWDQAIHDPERGGDDLPDDIEGPLCDAEEAALLAYLLHPAESLAELARKLRTFHQEGASGSARVAEITNALAFDGLTLARGVLPIASVDRRDGSLGSDAA
jgi:hypothetical protein